MSIQSYSHKPYNNYFLCPGSNIWDCLHVVSYTLQMPVLPTSCQEYAAVQCEWSTPYLWIHFAIKSTHVKKCELLMSNHYCKSCFSWHKKYLLFTVTYIITYETIVQFYIINTMRHWDNVFLPILLVMSCDNTCKLNT